MSLVDKIIEQYNEININYILGSWMYPNENIYTIKQEVMYGYCKNCLKLMTINDHDYQDFFDDGGFRYRSFRHCYEQVQDLDY